MADSKKIGSYEAKTNLPELLRQVQQGQRFRITNRGRSVADLVPVGAEQTENYRASARAMRALMQSRLGLNGQAIDDAQIKAWISEGRE